MIKNIFVLIVLCLGFCSIKSLATQIYPSAKVQELMENPHIEYPVSLNTLLKDLNLGKLKHYLLWLNSKKVDHALLKFFDVEALKNEAENSKVYDVLMKDFIINSFKINRILIVDELAPKSYKAIYPNQRLRLLEQYLLNYAFLLDKKNTVEEDSFNRYALLELVKRFHGKPEIFQDSPINFALKKANELLHTMETYGGFFIGNIALPKIEQENPSSQKKTPLTYLKISQLFESEENKEAVEAQRTSGKKRSCPPKNLHTEKHKKIKLNDEERLKSPPGSPSAFIWGSH